MPRALPKLFNTSEPVPFEDGGYASVAPGTEDLLAAFDVPTVAPEAQAQAAQSLYQPAPQWVPTPYTPPPPPPPSVVFYEDGSSELVDPASELIAMQAWAEAQALQQPTTYDSVPGFDYTPWEPQPTLAESRDNFGMYNPISEEPWQAMYAQNYRANQPREYASPFLAQQRAAQAFAQSGLDPRLAGLVPSVPLDRTDVGGYYVPPYDGGGNYTALPRPKLAPNSWDDSTVFHEMIHAVEQWLTPEERLALEDLMLSNPTEIAAAGFGPAEYHTGGLTRYADQWGQGTSIISDTNNAGRDSVSKGLDDQYLADAYRAAYDIQMNNPRAGAIPAPILSWLNQMLPVIERRMNRTNPGGGGGGGSF